MKFSNYLLLALYLADKARDLRVFQITSECRLRSVSYPSCQFFYKIIFNIDVFQAKKIEAKFGENPLVFYHI